MKSSDLWRCTSCHAPSHKPANDEVVTCQTCKSVGSEPVSRAAVMDGSGVIFPLKTARSLLSDKLREGDIITLGSSENLAHDRTTGFPVSLNQRFRIVAAD